MSRFPATERSRPSVIPAEALAPLPERLYRFRTFGSTRTSEDDRAGLFDLLGGRVRFARLRDFNDPFEGRPFPVPAFADAGQQRAAMRQYFCDMQMSTGHSRREARKQADQFMAGKTQAEIVEWVGERYVALSDQEGLYVCCLSGAEALVTPLAWSHYADHHRGVAVHFDTRVPPFRGAFPVIYSEEYPEVVVPRTHQGKWEHVVRTYFTKSSLWQYEREFRIIRVDWFGKVRDARAVNLQVPWDGSTAIAAPEAVVGITMGARMAPPDRSELAAKVRDQFPRLEIWQARLHRSKYEICSERIA